MAAAITSIIGLQNLTNLQDFRADWNSLSAVNLSGLSNLTYVDISDNESPGTEGQSSLTSVNLSGSTALQELRLDDSNFSAGIPNLTGLINIGWLDMDQCGITGNVDLSILPALYGFDLGGNIGLTSVTIFEQVLESVNISNCALTEASVNDTLGWLDGGGYTNGFVDLSGGTNAIPTGSGLTAVTNLQNKGWSVYVNQTTTTTTTLQEFYYTSDYYFCIGGGCQFDQPNAIIRSTTPLSIGSWYTDSFSTNTKFLINGTTAADPLYYEVDVTSESSACNC